MLEKIINGLISGVFQVLAAAGMNVRTFWNISPHILVKVDWRFTDAYCLHHDSDGGSKHL
jgi:hypothetical protein